MNQQFYPSINHIATLQIIQGEQIWVVGQAIPDNTTAPALTFCLDTKSVPTDFSLTINIFSADRIWHVSAPELLSKILHRDLLPELWWIIVQVIQRIPVRLKPVWLEHYCSNLVLQRFPTHSRSAFSL
jgi:hypothetical protein